MRNWHRWGPCIYLLPKDRGFDPCICTRGRACGDHAPSREQLHLLCLPRPPGTIFLVSMALHMLYFTTTLSHRREVKAVEKAAKTFDFEGELAAQEAKHRK